MTPGAPACLRVLRRRRVGEKTGKGGETSTSSHTPLGCSCRGCGLLPLNPGVISVLVEIQLIQPPASSVSGALLGLVFLTPPSWRLLHGEPDFKVAVPQLRLRAPFSDPIAPPAALEISLPVSILSSSGCSFLFIISTWHLTRAVSIRNSGFPRPDGSCSSPYLPHVSAVRQTQIPSSHTRLCPSHPWASLVNTSFKVDPETS